MIFLADANPIYAADVIDEAGRPVLPRQTPFEKHIQLYMTDGDEADRGAFVDVLVNPPRALQLITVDDTCEHLSGSFRCTAEEDGFANFKVRSESDQSGKVTLSFVDRSSPSQDITVNPAGLPTGSTVSMIIGGVQNEAGQKNVPARYNALECTINPEPDSTFNKWPEGAVRVREAEVRATGPTATPGVVQHAPVIVQTLNPEGFVTLDPTCEPPRTSRLRVQLDELGRSPRFYLCFSDLGGEIKVSYLSGNATPVAQEVTIDVDPEPRLLRVITLSGATTLTTGLDAVDILEVTGYDAELNETSFKVDLGSSDTSVLTLPDASEQLPSKGQTAVKIRATPVGPGTAKLQITPALHSSPLCESLLITVQ